MQRCKDMQTSRSRSTSTGLLGETSMHRINRLKSSTAPPRSMLSLFAVMVVALIGVSAAPAGAAERSSGTPTKTTLAPPLATPRGSSATGDVSTAQTTTPCSNIYYGARYDGFTGLPKTIIFYGNIECGYPVMETTGTVTLYYGDGTFESQASCYVQVLCHAEGRYYDTFRTLPATSHLLQWQYVAVVAPDWTWTSADASCTGIGTRRLECNYLSSIQVPL